MALSLVNLFTNPPNPHDLMLGSNRFSCRGIEYPHAAVKSLRFYAGQIEHYRNGSCVATSYIADFDIVLHKQSKPIRIRPRGGVIGRFYAEYSSELQNEVRDAYMTLAKQTFLQRLGSFQREIEEYGCFKYDGKKFYPDGRVTNGDQTFDLKVQSKNGKLLKRPFAVYVELPKSFIGKVVNRLAQRDVGIPGIQERDFVISTEYDQDVFFHLLREHFGIRWE